MRSVLGRAGTTALAVSLLTLASCVKNTRGPAAPRPPATRVDSVTVALWRMDESGGLRAADAGPFWLHATAGPDVSSIFGWAQNARLFSASTNSFLYVPYGPSLDLPSALTIEAWVAPNAFAAYEVSVIAARWSPPTSDLSWMFGIAGRNVTNAFGAAAGPGWFRSVAQSTEYGHLMFVYQPEPAGAPRAYFSLSQVPLQRWTQVAVTFDGEVVSLWLDGKMDGVYASVERIRPSQAPLLIGNLFDPRALTDFGGDLRQGPEAMANPWYALDGGLDELRISRVARTGFPLTGTR